MPFFADVHPMTLNDRIIERLEYANCGHVQIGVQSANEEVRRKYFNRNHSNQKLIDVLDRLRRSKIFVGTDMIIQYPNQTIADVLEEADFYAEHRVNAIDAFFLRYHAGTKITERAPRRYSVG